MFIFTLYFYIFLSTENVSSPSQKVNQKTDSNLHLYFGPRLTDSNPVFLNTLYIVPYTWLLFSLYPSEFFTLFLNNF